MGSAVGWRLGLVLVGVMAVTTACGRGRPVLEYDDRVTTVETAEPVPQRGLDRGAAPPPMVRMPGEAGGVAAPTPPPRMVPADESAFAPAAAEADLQLDPPAAEAAGGYAPAQGDPAPMPANAVGSDVEPDLEERAAGKVEIAPTPGEAAREALPAKPPPDAAVRTTNPWHKAQPWN